MKYKFIILLYLSFALCGCNSDDLTNGTTTYQAQSSDDAEDIDFVDVGIDFIDVRPPEQYNNTHLKGAKNIPLDTLESSIEKHYPDKSKPLAVYCNKGNWSKKAKAILVKKGYTNVRDLGGLNSIKLPKESAK